MTTMKLTQHTGVDGYLENSMDKVSLAGSGLWGRKESNMTQRLTVSLSLWCR